MVDFLQRDLGTELMENRPIKWVLRITGREDLFFTLHENKESALKECAQLNRKFRDRFYVDEYHPVEEKRYESIG